MQHTATVKMVRRKGALFIVSTFACEWRRNVPHRFREPWISGHSAMLVHRQCRCPDKERNATEFRPLALLP